MSTCNDFICLFTIIASSEARNKIQWIKHYTWEIHCLQQWTPSMLGRKSTHSKDKETYLDRTLKRSEVADKNGSKLRFEEWGKIRHTVVVEKEFGTERKVSCSYIDFFSCACFNCFELNWDHFRTKSSIHWHFFL